MQRVKLSGKVIFHNKGGSLQKLDHVAPGMKIIIVDSSAIKIEYDIVKFVKNFIQKNKRLNIDFVGVEYRMPINYIDALKEELKAKD